MKVLRITFLTVFAVSLHSLSAAISEAQTEWRVYSEPKRAIHFPDIPGYKTLRCDFHSHTVFSDGEVWPTVRVNEASREGLDAIAITDHIEYQPKKDDIPTNHNRSFEVATSLAKQKNLLMPRGTEITRDTPPGHFNAIFLKDVEPLDTKKLEDAAKAATEQGGFVFWNHPGWQGLEKGKWGEKQDLLYENKWLHGIEVCNGSRYYPEAHQWAIEKNLTMMGNSDIHSPSLDRDPTSDSHRTLTLVFAREKTLESVRDALGQGRTAVWCKNQLIGKKEYLEAMFQASVRVGRPYHAEKNTYWLEIENLSEIDFELEKVDGEGPQQIKLPANSTIQARIKTKQPMDQVVLSYTVKNFLIAPETYLPVSVTVRLK